MLVLGDFVLHGGRISVRKTGNSARIDGRLIAEIAIWLRYHFLVLLRGLAARLRNGPGPAIWFTPDIPHPRYMIRTAAIWAGARIARTPAEADAAFFFEDATVSAPWARPHPRSFNFACTNISKSHVAAVFEQVFGYPLAVDPAVWNGEAVEKAEANAAHDGRIVLCPVTAEPGKTYQRLVDTVGPDGFATDLRTHCVGGRPVIVWMKKRRPAERFQPSNVSVTQHSPEEIYSPEELAKIGEFARAMGAHWCGLDILRDRDGRPYIVDVNKTDAGPIIALPLRDKLASTALLADALLQLVQNAPVF